MPRFDATPQEIYDKLHKEKKTPSQVAKEYGVNVGQVNRKLALYGIYGDKEASKHIAHIVDSNLDIAFGLKILFQMNMETVIEKREQAAAWEEERELFVEYAKHVLDSGVISLEDPRARWLERLANEKDPVTDFQKSSTETLKVMNAYSEQIRSVLDGQAVERLKQGIVQIYHIATPEIRNLIEKFIFTDDGGKATILEAQQEEMKKLAATIQINDDEDE